MCACLYFNVFWMGVSFVFVCVYLFLCIDVLCLGVLMCLSLLSFGVPVHMCLGVFFLY